MNEEPDEQPIMRAFYDQATNTFRIWCRYCRIWHMHSPFDGSRVAHCGWRYPKVISPYSKTGYILKRVGLFTPEVKQLKENA
jgi:hypothetical protein